MSMFEVGQIRPPSEVESLLIRVTRNCPWNKCTFCSLYKNQSFSIRSLEDIYADIDEVSRCIEALKNCDEEKLAHVDDLVYTNAKRWYHSGMKSVFLQDANSLIVKVDDLLRILKYIHAKLGKIERITSYARSHTIANIKDDELKQLAEAGLNRIHIGMETAADPVLLLIKKGVDKRTHIEAGVRVKKAGIELSEYFMPGIGGLEYSKLNAIETAEALNQIEPDYIRIRTLAVTEKSELYHDYLNGVFTRTNDDQMVLEIKWLIEHLTTSSYIKSDHILNLIPEIEGKLPEDKVQMLNAIDWYLELSAYHKILFRVGRRSGIFRKINDINDTIRRERVEALMQSYQINDQSIDAVIDEMMNRFI